MLKYKSSALSLNVRPYKVFEAANWLISHSNLYKDECIVLNNDWINQHSQDANDVNNDNSNLQQDTIDETGDNEEIIRNEIPEDESESTFTVTDFLEDEERQNILNIAPGKGNRPLSAFREKYCEELAYPGIFLGQERPDNKQRLVNITYSDICKSELRQSDRRAAMCIEKIFYKTKKLQMKILLGKWHITLRKCKGNNKNIKAGQIKQQGTLDRLIRHDDG